MRVISVAYLVFAPELPEPQAGSDAQAAAWVPVGSVGLTEDGGGQRPGTTRKLAFDHARILADGLERARSKLEYTPLATAFVADQFTIAELRTVYETVWGERLHAGNFHRKVLSVPGVRGEHRRDHRDRGPARRTAVPAVPPRGRTAAAPGAAASRTRGRGLMGSWAGPLRGDIANLYQFGPGL